MLWSSPVGAQPAETNLPGPPAGREVLPLPSVGSSTGEELAAVETRQVKSFTVDGDCHLSPEDIRAVVAPHEGQALTLEQIKKVAQQLTLRIQQKGYMLTRAIVPKQDFSSGVVTLKVIDSKVGQITVEGAKYHDSEAIKRRVAAVMDDKRTFNNADFQRALLLLNDIPDLDVTATLKPGQQTGTADVVLKVHDNSPFHIGLDYNNFGIPGGGENRAGLTMETTSLGVLGDHLYARGVLGFPADQQNFVMAGYDVPVNDNGTKIGFQYANGAFQTGQGNVLLDVRGGADIFTVSAFQPMTRTLDQSLDLALAVSHKSIHNDLNFSFFGTVPSTNEEYFCSRLSFFSDWRADDSRTLLQGAWTQGLGGSASIPSHYGASTNFTKFNLDAARIQTLGKGVYGLLRGSAQVATGPQFVGEQFGLGGPDSVRGYTQSEYLGDGGFTVSAELRWSPLNDNERFQTVFFIDHGQAWLNQPLAGERAHQNFTGAGLGLRFGLSEYSNLRVDLGFPLSPAENRYGRSPAIYTNLQTRF